MVSKVVEVTKEVNLWAENMTNVIDQPASSLLMHCFRGTRNEKFGVSITEDCDFPLLNGNSLKVPFMVSKKM